MHTLKIGDRFRFGLILHFGTFAVHVVTFNIIKRQSMGKDFTVLDNMVSGGATAAEIVAHLKKADRPTKASRLPDDFKPDFPFAIGCGLSKERVDLEAQKFLDYWTAKAGPSATKTNWNATWRNWIRTAIERNPPATPAVTGNGQSLPGFYAAATSPQLDAWDAYGKKTKGKTYPRDRAGGWRFPSEWPPAA